MCVLRVFLILVFYLIVFLIILRRARRRRRTFGRCADRALFGDLAVVPLSVREPNFGPGVPYLSTRRARGGLRDLWNSVGEL